jgi:hypothetical protein
MSESKEVKLTDLLTHEQLDEIERILDRCGTDRMQASNELRRYLVAHRAELEAKGVVPEYLAYVIAYRQWTGGDNGDRTVPANN